MQAAWPGYEGKVPADELGRARSFGLQRASRPPILQKAVYLGTWVADLTAHKIPVAENAGRCHCKAARTGTDPKSSIVGRAGLISLYVLEH